MVSNNHNTIDPLIFIAMKGTLEKQGDYELFETTKGHQILVLNQQAWFALIEGDQGDIIVHSDSDHEKKKTLYAGDFYLANFRDDPDFRDQPHLFLQEDDQYAEFILPNGLPTSKDHQKKLIRSEEKLSREKVMEHVKG